MKLSLRLFLALALSLFVKPVSAGTFSVNAWTGDASSGIVPGQTLWAYHFGITNTAVVNGITVPGTGPDGNPSVPGQFTIAGIPSSYFDDFNNLTSLFGSGSAVMANSFLYDGNPGSITVAGLTAGKSYTISVFGVGFDVSPTTRVSLFASGADNLLVNENNFGQDNGIRVDYTFTAAATTQLITVTPTNGFTFHTYGLALRQHPIVVTTTANSGPGSLRQAVSDATASAGLDIIIFAPALSGATINLASVIGLSAVLIDASSLPGGLTVSGGNLTQIFFTSGNVTLRGLTLTGANASNGAINNSGTLSLDRCTLTGNSASGLGGALFNFKGIVGLTNCTLTANQASAGGAIYSFIGPSTLVYCTLSGNSAASGGGVQGLQNVGPLTMINCLVAGNTATTGEGPDVRLEDASILPMLATNCLIGIGTNSGVTHGVNGNQVGTTAAPLDAQLAPFGNYGGPTQTMPPLPGSPAIDNTGGFPGLLVDQRGSFRDIGDAPDIGAVESGDLWVQNTNSGGAKSLSGVIADVSGLTLPKTILFIPSLSGTTIRVTNEIGLINQITIDADSLPVGLTLNGGNSNRLFRVLAGQSASLLGLTFTRGFAGDVGGAIVSDGNLSLTRCTLFTNTAPNGGALYNGAGLMALADCTVSGNSSAIQGGAIENHGLMTLTGCTLSSNSCGTAGGGIANYGGTLSLAQCTLAGNTSADYDGGIGNIGGTLTLAHCTVAFNRAAGTAPGFSGAGGIDNYNGGTLNLFASILSGNTAATGLGPDLWMEDGTLTATNSLIGNGSNSTITNGVNGNRVGVSAELAALGNYGGLTRTMPLLPGSPAINAATNSTGFTSDQRGYPRPVGLAPDMGAVEGVYNAGGPGMITNLMRLANGSIRFNLPNLTNGSFPVFVTTNVNQPTSNGTLVGFATETSAGLGQVNFTNVPPANQLQRFYRVKSP